MAPSALCKLSHSISALVAVSLCALAQPAHAQPASPMPADPAAMAPAPTAPAAAPAAAPATAPAAPATAPAATASPMPDDPAAMAPSAAPAASAPVAVPTSETPIALRDSCMAAINADQAWSDDLAAKLVKRMERDAFRDDLPWAVELRAIVQKRGAYDAHKTEATLIATNKRHVILAYAAIWLATVGFLLMQWRKQKALREQLDALAKDLGAAVKGSP